MAYVEAHQELADHPKTKRLMRLLAISRIQAIGHLFLLWWWAQDYAQDGDLSAFEDLDIAEAAEWIGDPDVFVKALQDAGWLDVRQLHDWDQYGGKVFRQRAANAAKVRNWRASHKTSDDGNEVERNGNVTVTSGNVTVPSLSNSLSISREGDRGGGEGETPQPKNGEADDWPIVKAAFEQHFGVLTKTEADDLKSGLLFYTGEEIAAAIPRARERHKRNVPYIFGICNNARKDYRTEQEIAAAPPVVCPAPDIGGFFNAA